MLRNQWKCFLAWWEMWRLTIPRRRFDLQRPVDAATEDDAGEVFAGSAVVVVGTEVETWVDVAEWEASAEETWVEEAWVDEAVAEDLLEDGAGSLP